MLEPSDILELAPDVLVEGGHVRDAVRGTAWPVNETALWMLDQSGKSLDEIAVALGTRHGITHDQAAHDVMLFAWQLNSALLANIRVRRSRWRQALAWLRLASRLAPAGALPPARARRDRIDTRSASSAVVSVARALRRRAVGLAVVSGAVAVQLSTAAGDPSPTIALALGAGVGLGLVVHETGHAVALRGVAAALVLSGTRTFVLHAAIGSRRRALVAAAGPLASAGVGLVAIEAAAAFHVVELALVALPLCGHALAATVLSPDGRTACVR